MTKLKSRNKTYDFCLRAIMLAVTISLSSQAVAMTYQFHSLTTCDGLYSRYVNDILRDTIGRVWMATSLGLNSYDGYRVSRYEVEGRTTTALTRLATDDFGQLWIDSEIGIFVLNLQYSSIYPQKQSAKKPSKEQLRQVGLSRMPLHISSDGQSGMWAWDNKQLTHTATRTHSATTIKTARPTVAVSSITANGTAYSVDAAGNINRIDLKRGSLQRIATVSSASAANLRIFVDKENRLYVWELFAPRLHCFYANGRSLSNTLTDKMPRYGAISDIEQAPDGSLWLSTNENGIVVWRDANVVEQLSYSTSAFSLPTNHTVALYLDHDNLMWVGTSKRGVAFAPLQSLPINIVRTPIDEDIAAIQQTSDGQLIIGYDGKGLSFGSRHIQMSNSSLKSDLVVGINKGTTNGKFWIGTYGGGIHRMDAAGNIYPIEIQGDGADLRHVRFVYEATNGCLWAGSFRTGLYCMQPSGTDRYRVISHFSTNNSCLKAQTITGLLPSADGQKLIVAASRGLYVVDLPTRRLTAIDTNLEIECMLRDKQGLLWLGLRNGLCIMDAHYKPIATLYKNNGLSDNHIVALACDPLGNLWATTDNGLTNIVKQRDGSFSLFPYYESDGLGSAMFNRHSILVTNEGHILAGSLGSYVDIDPMDFQPVAERSVVRYTSFLVDGGQPIEICQQVAAGRTLVVEVSAMKCTGQDKIAYLYSLDGKPWQTALKNQIMLGSLPVGRYTLRVKTDGGSIDTPISTLKFSVGHWWQHRFFHAAILLLLVGGLCWIVVMVYRRYKQVHPYAVSAAEIEVDTPDAQFLQSLADILEKHIGESDFSVEQLAQAVGMSRSNLFRRMKQLTGDTPLEFIHRYRLQRGEQMLRQGHSSISQISWSVGMSPKQFSALFSKHYGTTPSAYISLDKKEKPNSLSE